MPGGLIDKVVDIFLGGPNNWEERLKDRIKFTSPEGNEFEGRWIGSPRSKDKKLAIFAYPKVRGNIVQDLDTNSSRYSITFYFDGADNDVTARAFYAACDENGLWDIDHPVHGFLGLQLMSVTENDEPVVSGNVTEINTEWIEPIDETTLKTARELAGIVDGLSNDLNTSTLDQIVNGINQGTEAFKEGVRIGVNGVQNLSDFALGPLAATVDAVDSTFRAIQDGINDTLNATVLQIRALAGQIQALIQTPLLARNSINSRLSNYDDFQEGAFTLLPGGSGTSVSDKPTVEAKNQALIAELALSANIVARCQITTITPIAAGGLLTRAQAVEAANNLANDLQTITNNLDAIQQTFAVNTIDQQFFSQSESYADAAQIVAYAIQYLLVSAFDLKIEKRFKLNRPRTPIEIAITEYGDLGDNDANLDLFIESNGLKGNDILLLPAGREVVVYV